MILIRIGLELKVSYIKPEQIRHKYDLMTRTTKSKQNLQDVNESLGRRLT